VTDVGLYEGPGLSLSVGIIVGKEDGSTLAIKEAVGVLDGWITLEGISVGDTIG